MAVEHEHQAKQNANQSAKWSIFGKPASATDTVSTSVTSSVAGAGDAATPRHSAVQAWYTHRTNHVCAVTISHCWMHPSTELPPWTSTKTRHYVSASHGHWWPPDWQLRGCYGTHVPQGDVKSSASDDCSFSHRQMSKVSDVNSRALAVMYSLDAEDFATHWVTVASISERFPPSRHHIKNISTQYTQAQHTNTVH